MTRTISNKTMRRFIMGKQGLWPGRRWQGRSGVVQAIHEMGAVQVDPLQVVARNHDLELFSRVADYHPDHLNDLLYTDRQFFDYGGFLQIYPMAELPYWKVHMQRHIGGPRWAEFVEGNQAVIDNVRAEIRARGPLGHRDVEGTARISNYRARKDSGLAMYYLWRTGELMTAGRRGFDRLYDFAENVAPVQHLMCADAAEAEDYFLRKVLKMEGLARLTVLRGSFAYYANRTVTIDELKSRIAALEDAGEVAALKVEGLKDVYYAFAPDMPIIDTLEAGQIPQDWTLLDTSTDQEVNFLSPLDPVTARGRAAKLFDFEYKWEIYTPVEKRKWGYYVLPILYGDDLVARVDVKLDRPNKTLLLKGFWLEEPATAKDQAFASALARGLVRFTRFHGVSRLDAAAIKPASLRAAKLFKGSGITLL